MLRRRGRGNPRPTIVRLLLIIIIIITVTVIVVVVVVVVGWRARDDDDDEGGHGKRRNQRRRVRVIISSPNFRSPGAVRPALVGPSVSLRHGARRDPYARPPSVKCVARANGIDFTDARGFRWRAHGVYILHPTTFKNDRKKKERHPT